MISLGAAEWAAIDAVSARSRDPYRLIGDCGDEYRRCGGTRRVSAHCSDGSTV